MKTFTFLYTHTVTVEATVLAENEADARIKFEKGDHNGELDIDSCDVDLLSVKEEVDE